MIKLFESNETSFTTNGLGFLTDATSCTVTEKLNGEYELEMEYPVNGIRYSDIKTDRLILVNEKNKRPQPFRIYSISKPINQIVTIHAQHISYDLSNITVKGALENYAYTLDEVFEYIRRCVMQTCPYTFSSDITKKSNMCLSKPRSVRNILGSNDNGCISLFGGEIEFDLYDVILHKHRGMDRGACLEYGKNITDLTQEENISEMYTSLYPYYFVEDDGLQYLDDGPIKFITNPAREKTLTVDLTSSFDEMPTQSKLKEEGEKYIKDNKLNEPKVSLTVSFISDPDIPEFLQDIRLGDTVTVKFVKLGVNTKSRCISTTYNCITEKYDEIELGETSANIVDTIASTSNTQSEIQKQITETHVKINKTETAIYQEIDDTNGNLNSLTETVDGVTREVTNINGDITNLQVRADGLDASVSNANNDITNLQVRADGLDASVSNANGDISSLKLRANGWDSSISNINGDINTISARADSFSVDLRNLETNTNASLSMKVGKNDNDQIVSMLNASADVITLTSNRLVVDSTNFNLDGNGNVSMKGKVEATSGSVGPFNITSSGLEWSSGGTRIWSNVLFTDYIEPDQSSKHLTIGSLSSVNRGKLDLYSSDGGVYINDTYFNPSSSISLNSSKIDVTYTSVGNVKIENCQGFISEGSSGYGNLATVGYVKSKVSSSDKRIKKNIFDIPDITELFMDIPMYQFEYDEIEERDGICFGTTAQAIEEAFTKHDLDITKYNIVQTRTPNLFNGEYMHIPAGDMLHYINWENLNGMTMYVVQKLVKTVNTLTEEINELKTKIGGN